MQEQLPRVNVVNNAAVSRITGIHRPLFVSVLLLGFAGATLLLNLPIEWQSIIFSRLSTIAILLWAKFLL